MKNIHILPTDKPSRIRIGDNGNFVIGLTQNSIRSRNDSFTNQHIYITSDEEVKEGDYCISHLNIIDEGKIHNSQTVFNPKTKENLILLKSCKKIILTTDQDLIKDGVQAIGDEFIQWFVKNPSCEEVEVNSIETNPDYKSNWENRFTYKIIIPKEEPKQERRYSEEEVLEIIRQYALEEHLITSSKPDIWFEQFKKK